MTEHTMTPDELFDELDKVFGCEDGYVNHLQRIKDLRNFKANITKLLFDDLNLSLPEGVQFNDRDIYECIEGLRNLQTGFDEYDPEDGEYVKHHPSYKALEEENKKLKETNGKRFDEIKEMEKEVGVAKLVHHQNLELVEEIKKLKSENTRVKFQNEKLLKERIDIFVGKKKLED